MRDDNSMSEAARQLLEEFESLPEPDQRAVAAEILRRTRESTGLSPVVAEMEDPLDDLDDLTAEQCDEIDRRLAEHDRNPDSAIPWEEVRARLYRRFA